MLKNTALLVVRQAKYAELMADQTYLQSVLDKGREFAQKCANRMMAKVYRKAGMI